MIFPYIKPKTSNQVYSIIPPVILPPTHSVPTPSAISNNVVEAGSIIYFGVLTENTNVTTYYWTISGSAQDTDFTSPTNVSSSGGTISVTINSNGVGNGIVPFEISQTPTDGRTFQLQLREYTEGAGLGNKTGSLLATGSQFTLNYEPGVTTTPIFGKNYLYVGIAQGTSSLDPNGTSNYNALIVSASGVVATGQWSASHGQPIKALTTDISGNLYIAGNVNTDAGNAYIRIYSSSGALIQSIDNSNTNNPEQTAGNLNCIHVDSSQSIYVGGSRVMKYTSGSGGWALSWSSSLFPAKNSNEENNFTSQITSITTDVSGNLYFGGPDANRFRGTPITNNIQKWTYNGGSGQGQYTIGWSGSWGLYAYNSTRANGVDLILSTDNQSNLYVASGWQPTNVNNSPTDFPFPAYLQKYIYQGGTGQSQYPATASFSASFGNTEVVGPPLIGQQTNGGTSAMNFRPQSMFVDTNQTIYLGSNPFPGEGEGNNNTSPNTDFYALRIFVTGSNNVDYTKYPISTWTNPDVTPILLDATTFVPRTPHISAITVDYQGNIYIARKSINSSTDFTYVAQRYVKNIIDNQPSWILDPNFSNNTGSISFNNVVNSLVYRTEVQSTATSTVGGINNGIIITTPNKYFVEPTYVPEAPVGPTPGE